MITMTNEFNINEVTSINIDGGYIINGFPSTGLTSAIATELIINTSQFEFAATIDSDKFPPISIIKNGAPNYPTRIFVNNDIKTAIFSSYVTIDVSLHRDAARLMLNWAAEKKCSTIVSSITVRGTSQEIMGVASTGTARGKLVESGIKVAENAAIPGIPGVLLNEGMVNGKNVIVLLVSSESDTPDLKATYNLCDGISKLVPGITCNLSLLEKQARQIEEEIKQVETESKDLSDNMYR
jgi:uncharacterized protein|tara:strand:- start:253 stop:969 length:717 start_codon:yes stop_codon:yes gene_type:complete